MRLVPLGSVIGPESSVVDRKIGYDGAALLEGAPRSGRPEAGQLGGRDPVDPGAQGGGQVAAGDGAATGPLAVPCPAGRTRNVYDDDGVQRPLQHLRRWSV
jgi:hypothetical protein